MACRQRQQLIAIAVEKLTSQCVRHLVSGLPSPARQSKFSFTRDCHNVRFGRNQSEHFVPGSQIRSKSCGSFFSDEISLGFYSGPHLGFAHVPRHLPRLAKKWTFRWWRNSPAERAIRSCWWPSRPGEFHPEPLTDPDLTLSRHPARATARRLPPSIEYRVPPVAG
jgi:hypothetical protein